MKRKDYRLIIFDFDGTLADSAPDILATVNEMAAEYGLKKTKKQAVVNAIGGGLNKFLEDIFPSMLSKKTVWDLREHYVKIYRKRYKEKVRLYPYTKMVLSYLKKKGYTLVIVSNKARFFVVKTAVHLGIRKYFSAITGRGDLQYDKPHPFPFLYMAKKYRASKKSTLVVGDSVFDIKAAKNAGMDSVYLTHGYGKKTETKKQKPVYIMKNMLGMRKIL